MGEIDFLTLLVDETLRLQKSGEIELSSLELKLNDYRLKFLKGEFIPQSQMLRFMTPFGKIDFPVNWSIFSINAHVLNDVVLSATNDRDHLFTILKPTWDPAISKILITHADGFCYLVGLRPQEEAHLHDLVNPQVWLKKAA